MIIQNLDLVIKRVVSPPCLYTFVLWAKLLFAHFTMTPVVDLWTFVNPLVGPSTNAPYFHMIIYFGELHLHIKKLCRVNMCIWV